MDRPIGTSLAEVLVVVALAALAAGVGWPVLSRALGQSTAAAGATALAATIRGLGRQSVAEGRAHGLMFSVDARGQWSWHRVRDGNGNGLRTTEVRDGTDPTLSGPHHLSDDVPRARLGFPPGESFPRIPPRSGRITRTDDPIRLGNTNLLAMTPLGNASSGTLFVSDGRAALYAVVLFGPTSRIRIWRFDAEERTWKR